MTTVADLKGQTVAFAASGGLDSCTVTKWLTENGVNVVCLTADIAQPDEANFDEVGTRMMACGASEYIAIPLHDMIAESGLEVIQFQARYEGAYWNTTGIGRHVIVAESDVFRVLDLGTWAQSHGDHAHYRTAPPKATDIRIAAPEPGHVVVHDGTTVLFADGTGTATSVPSDRIGDRAAPRSVYTTPAPHHGVAVQRTDGSLLITVGDDSARTGVAVLDAHRVAVTEAKNCPGVHGEGAAAGGVVVFGCEDGLLVVHGDRVVKVASPTPGYARIGNVAATEAHAVVLGDFKVDKAAQPERPTRVSLIDTRTDTLRLVELPSSYSFRSLARGQFGEALVLGTDGVLRFLDPDSGAITGELKVTEPWTESSQWQDPRPAVTTLGSTAYVTDPATKTVTAVDIPKRQAMKKAAVAHIPDETAAVSGAFY